MKSSIQKAIKHSIWYDVFDMLRYELNHEKMYGFCLLDIVLQNHKVCLILSLSICWFFTLIFIMFACSSQADWGTQIARNLIVFPLFNRACKLLFIKGLLEIHVFLGSDILLKWKTTCKNGLNHESFNIFPG